MQPVDPFYGVHLANAHVLREWSLRVLEVAASKDDVPMWAVPRVVVLIPLQAPPHGPIYAYVSEGARGLASGLTTHVMLDRDKIPMRDLPDGLGVLLGDAGDTRAYEQRRKSHE
jgi:hypothetical protein